MIRPDEQRAALLQLRQALAQCRQAGLAMATSDRPGELLALAWTGTRWDSTGRIALPQIEHRSHPSSNY